MSISHWTLDSTIVCSDWIPVSCARRGLIPVDLISNGADCERMRASCRRTFTLRERSTFEKKAFLGYGGPLQRLFSVPMARHHVLSMPACKYWCALC